MAEVPGGNRVERAGGVDGRGVDLPADAPSANSGGVRAGYGHQVAVRLSDGM